MTSVVIAIHLMLILALIGVVLLQKSEGGGFVSSTSGFLSSRGTANVLTRATALLAAGFFVTSLALSLLASREREPASIIGGGPAQQSPSGTNPPPITPLNTGSGGLLNQLGGGAPQGTAPAAGSGSTSGTQKPAGPATASAPQTPSTPSAPQVPQSR